MSYYICWFIKYILTHIQDIVSIISRYIVCTYNACFIHILLDMILIKNIRGYAHSSKSKIQNNNEDKFTNKAMYLHDISAPGLVTKFDTYEDLVKELKLSKSTISKYKDSGKLFRDKYIISSYCTNDLTALEKLRVNKVINGKKVTTDKINKFVSSTKSKSSSRFSFLHFSRIDYSDLFHTLVDVSITLLLIIGITVLYILSLACEEDNMFLDFDCNIDDEEIGSVHQKEVDLEQVDNKIYEKEVKSNQHDNQLVDFKSFLSKFNDKTRSLSIGYENISCDDLTQGIHWNRCIDRCIDRCENSPVTADTSKSLTTVIKDDHMKSLINENEELISRVMKLESKFIISELKRDIQRRSIQSLIDEISVATRHLNESSNINHSRSKTI